MKSYWASRFAAVIALCLLAVNAATAAPQDAVMNKEGYWGIDVDGSACAASMTLQGGAVFLLRGEDGDVSVALFTRSAMPRGKTLGLDIDGRVIELPASFVEERTAVYLDGALEPSALASLMAARQMRVLVDGRVVAAMTLEGTGLAGAVDGLVACSRGQAGWWGKGVQAAAAEAPASQDAPAFVYNREGVWGITVREDPRVCIAQAAVGDRNLQFLAVRNVVGIGVASPGGPLPKGRKGLIETDTQRIAFGVNRDPDDYMTSDDPLSAEALESLRSAAWLRVTVGGRAVIEADLQGSGFADLLPAVAACSRGEKGWWDGAAANETR